MFFESYGDILRMMLSVLLVQDHHTSSRASPSQPANSRSTSYDNPIFTVTGDRSSFPAGKYASTATTPSQRDEFLTDKPQHSPASIAVKPYAMSVNCVAL